MAPADHAPTQYLDSELYLMAEDQARFSVLGCDYVGRPALGPELRRRLLGAALDPRQYGTLLCQALFPPNGDDLFAGFRSSLAIARHRQQRLRFRLHIAPSAPLELHELHWELLYDEARRTALSRSQETAFSRYLSVSLEPGAAVVERPRMLVVLSHPGDLAGYGLPEIGERKMRQAVEKALEPLAEAVAYEVLEGPATTGRIRDRLVAGRFHVLHLVGHGRAHPHEGTSSLVLEDGERRARFVDQHLFAEIFEGERNLRLVTLIACHSGVLHGSDPFSGLGQALVRHGLPAVVAMQRAISVDAAVHFTTHLYRNLAREATIDTAVNEARCQLYLGELREWFCPVLFMRLRDARLWESPRPGPVAGAASGPVEIRDDFLSRVEKVCRLREGDAAEIQRVRTEAASSEYLRVSVDDDGIARIYPVGAVRGAVTAGSLDALLEVHRGYREADPGVISTLVYGGPPPPQELGRRAARERVRLRSFVEYQGLIDFRGYVARQTQKLAADPLYPPRLYVPQRIRYRVGDDEREEPAVATLDGWLRDDRGRFVLVLGDFGTGKTFLLHELARRLGEEGGPLIPVLIEMRTLEKGRHLNELVAQHLARSGVERIDLKAFRFMLEQGRVALLFDGFDELALRTTYDSATQHFSTLIEAAQGGEAKVIVTSRTQHFVSDRQVRTALGERVEQLAGRRIVHLRRFDERQIRRFLVNLLGDEEAADERLALIDEVRDLIGLSQNPRLLAFITDIDADELRAAKARDGSITAAGLYQLLLDRWLGYEHERLQPDGALPVLTVAERWQAVTRLALRLWTRREHDVDVGELTEEAARTVAALARQRRGAGERLSEGVAAQQVGSGTLLVRDAEGAFSFIHHSVAEWLVARRAARDLEETGDSDVLGIRVMSPLMAQFLCDLGGREPSLAWARQALSREPGEVVQQNALLILDQLGETTRAALRLADQDLRGKDLSGRDLEEADLRRANLESARLVGARLRRARLSGARLRGADLSGADLSGADLSGADLGGARLLGGDLRQSGLEGCVLRRTKLVGASVEEGALARARRFGIAPPRPAAVEPWVGSSSPGRALDWSGDGELLASGHDDGTLRLWDAAASLEIRRFCYDGAVLAAAFSPDGRFLAASAGGAVRLVDLATGRGRTLAGHEAAVWCVAWSPQGEDLASASMDGSVRLWKRSTGAVSATFGADGAAVWSVAWSPDGRMLAAGCDDGRVRLWDPAAGLFLRALEGCGAAVWSVAWSPDAERLACGSAEGRVGLWQGPEGEPRWLEGHPAGVWSVAWSPDGRQLTSASRDRTLRVWDATTGELKCRLEGHTAPVSSVVYRPDGRRLASASEDRRLKVWDPGTGEQTRTLGRNLSALRHLAWSPDGGRLASTSLERRIHVWEVAAAPRILEGSVGRVLSVAWSPDGDALATGSDDRTVDVWDLRSGEPTRSLTGHAAAIPSVAWSPDGKRLASGSGDRTIRLWDAAAGESLHTLTGHARTVLSVAWSPGGRWLASGSSDRTARLWDTATGDSGRRLEGHVGAVLSVAWSPDGKRLATGSADGTARWWDVGSGEVGGSWRARAGAVLSVAWSPDGECLAFGASDHRVRLCDVATAAPCRALEEHTGEVACLGFSPGGRFLASGAADSTIRVWHVSSGRCLAVLAPLPEGWVAFTPDGRYRLGGEHAGAFWHSVGLCRFEAGELDAYLPEPLRVGAGEPLHPLMANPDPPAVSSSPDLRVDEGRST